MKSIFKPLILVLLITAFTSCSNSVNETDAFKQSKPMIEQLTKDVLKQPKFNEKNWTFKKNSSNIYVIKGEVSGKENSGYPTKIFYKVKMIYDPGSKKWSNSEITYSYSESNITL